MSNNISVEKIQVNTKKKLENVATIIPTEDVLQFFKLLTEAYKEYQITERDIAKIEAQKEILLTEINRKYDLYFTVFNKIFEERKSVVDKSFGIINEGLEKDDKQLISMGLHSLSQVVSSSPFADINRLSATLENSQTIMI